MHVCVRVCENERDMHINPTTLPKTGDTGDDKLYGLFPLISIFFILSVISMIIGSLDPTPDCNSTLVKN